MDYEKRPDPDELLSKIMKRPSGRGRFKIFFGMSPGVGKTYSMLKEARVLLDRGEDVVIGWMESHGRKETDELAKGIELIPAKTVEYRGISLTEMDLDAILARKPSFALIDELAHSNAPGMKHPKRYQDIQDLLDAGISVYTTVNIQHLETISDAVEELAGIRIQERIPDAVFDQADDIQLVDIPPDELITRLEEGKVYIGDKSRDAIENFFRRENLAVLRELSLRHASQLASHQLTSLLRGDGSAMPTATVQNVLVAVSPSPNSEYLIRWARRFAYSMKANWTCIHVETGVQMSEYAKDCLTKNLTLARNLGATVVSVPDEDAVNGILEYASKNNVSSIIIGKSGVNVARRIFFRDTMSERIIRESGKISVVTVQEKASRDDFRSHLKKKVEGSRLWQYGFALAAVSLVTALNFLIVQFAGYWSASIFYLATISLLALILEPRPVFIAACLSAIFWDYFFIPPQYTFAISKFEDILMFCLYFLIALTSGWMTSKLKTNERMLKVREQRMSLINELSSSLERVNGARNAVMAGVEYVSRAFKAGTVVFLKRNDDDSLCETPVNQEGYVPNDKELSAAKYCFSSGQSAGRFTTTLPVVSYHYVPMAAPGGTIGVIGIRLDNGKLLANDQESFLLTLSSTISLAVEREILSEKNRKNLLVQESERLSRILLNLISHELRTPLTVIQGSASALMDSETAEDRTSRDLLVEEILSNAVKLNSIVENLLSMNRLESGRLKLRMEKTDPEDLISLALRQVRKDLGKRPVTIVKPDTIPLVKCDIVLIIQVLANILQNSSRYTDEGTPLEIRIEVLDESMHFIVRDSGPGVTAEELPHLFDKFYRGEGGKKGGTGLGLSICKGIIEAHKGYIAARNRTGGGFAVEFTLPLDKEMPK
ncbi:MAG: sensor histidine kinase KdpD [Victivallales bacterium]